MPFCNRERKHVELRCINSLLWSGPSVRRQHQFAQDDVCGMGEKMLTAFVDGAKLADASCVGSSSSKHHRGFFSSVSAFFRYSPRNNSADKASTDGFSAKMTSTSLYMLRLKSSQNLEHGIITIKCMRISQTI